MPDAVADVASDGATPGLRILTVCTGNICRSPVAERALARALHARGIPAVVRSAGTIGGLPNDRTTVRAAEAAGIALADHVSRRLTERLIETDGADLVIAMSRRHLREVVAMVPDAWPRTFTLGEMARRAPFVRPDVSFEQWRADVAGERTMASMLQPAPGDDVPDPHGRGYRDHARMVALVSGLVDTVVSVWPTPQTDATLEREI